MFLLLRSRRYLAIDSTPTNPETLFNPIEPSAVKPQPKQQALPFTTETRSSQRSKYFLIKNFLLCALRASAVNSLLVRSLPFILGNITQCRQLLQSWIGARFISLHFALALIRVQQSNPSPPNRLGSTLEIVSRTRATRKKNFVGDALCPIICISTKDTPVYRQCSWKQ